jgi:hypothetical protein
MLKDADHSYFTSVYIVCGYTDLRFRIDSLAAIAERKFHMHLFVPNTLFLFCGRSSTSSSIMFLLMREVPDMIQLSDEQLNNLGKEALVAIVSSLQNQRSLPCSPS